MATIRWCPIFPSHGTFTNPWSHGWLSELVGYELQLAHLAISWKSRSPPTGELLLNSIRKHITIQFPIGSMYGIYIYMETFIINIALIYHTWILWVLKGCWCLGDQFLKCRLKWCDLRLISWVLWAHIRMLGLGLSSNRTGVFVQKYL